MTQIIGFAGKKQSGKNTCCNFLTMLKLLENGVCKKARLCEETGEIEVSDIFGDALQDKEWFLFKSPTVNTEAVLNDMGSIKIYALADDLKRIAIDVLGLPEDKVYGTDDDKNELTHLRWENMPGVYSGNQEILLDYEGLNITYHEPGPMTIREVLQYMGTEVFRRMYEKVWVESCLRRIRKDNPDIALICDVRFDNEMITLKEEDALLLGLTKDVFKSKDLHASEQVNLSLCHKTIKNDSLSIAEQNKEVYFALKELGCGHLTDLGV